MLGATARREPDKYGWTFIRFNRDEVLKLWPLDIVPTVRTNEASDIVAISVTVQHQQTLTEAIIDVAEKLWPGRVIPVDDASATD